MLEHLTVFIENHGGNIVDISGKVIASIVTLVLGLLLSKGFKRLLRKAVCSSIPCDATAAAILRHIINYGLFLIVLIIILNIFGVNTASLLAILGAAGIAVGLALRDTLSNIASGIVLFFLGTYRYGEFIEFGSFSGTVKEINLFTTILETPDGIFISAPNSSIWGSPLRNFSRNGKRRMEIPISISYSDSIDTAVKVLTEMAENETRFLKEPAPQVLVQSIGDSSINLCLRAWAETDDYWSIYWDIMRKLKDKIENAGLVIPYPQSDVYVSMKN